MFRRVIVVGASLLLVALDPSAVSAAPCWRAPVVGRVTDPFRKPPCAYCAGNRGLEYAIAPSSVVRAVESGEVAWSGMIAGVRSVVVRHSNGWRATYSRLDRSDVRVGDRVATNGRIGTASWEFYFGLRDGNRYIDPSPYLRRLIGRPRLVPIDGTRSRPAPAPRLSCSSRA